MAFWRRRTVELPEGWEDRVADLVPLWHRFDDDEQERLAELTERIVAEKRWEAANGFALTDDIRMTIAVQAALLVLELSFEHYDQVRTIIVHPTTMVLTGERRAGDSGGLLTDDPVAILGQAAHAGGPVVVAWDEVRRNARHPDRGFNVVFHEFAHKLDMLDHVVDGTPPLASAEQRDRWVEVCTREFQSLRHGAHDHLLRDYAAVNAGEFFAVATEGFFDRPVDLRRHHVDLYEVLGDFYRQDPATRAERVAHGLDPVAEAG